VVIPHFPTPGSSMRRNSRRGIDAVEMTAWGNLYGGIDPYSLSDCIDTSTTATSWRPSAARTR